MKIAIIGGGAAGFFAAIRAKSLFPRYEVTVFEKSANVLSKVKISGGGRCNVTNACDNILEFSKAYPRGGNGLKKLFHVFSNHDTMKWFDERGVPLVVQEDNCVFPKSQDSQSIIDCFLQEADKLPIRIQTNARVEWLEPGGEGWRLLFDTSDQTKPASFDKVIVTTGGSPREDGLLWLKELGHKIEKPVPSLFTFNMPDENVTSLMGIVAENVAVSIQGTKYSADGTLLITHWGMSGPAILKLSSFAARYLNEANYEFSVLVNWIGEKNYEVVVQYVEKLLTDSPQKLIAKCRLPLLPERLWKFLLEKAGIDMTKKCGEMSRKEKNRLVDILINDTYRVKGKSTFRDEFVTCGGVSLKDVNLKSMESKVCKNLYFAGEVLDIDAITGGYNLQAAWTTGYVAGQLGGG